MPAPTANHPPALAWDSFVARHQYGHLLQTTNWGALKARFGWRTELVTITEEGELVAGAQVLYRRPPLIPFSIAYVPKGPVVDWEQPEQVEAILEKLAAAAQGKKAILLRVEPNLPHSSSLDLGTDFLSAGKGVQPRRTLVVDIRGEEAEILGRMKPKTRYNIRLAGRKGVEARAGTAADLPIFNRLMSATGERNRFGVHSPAYYRAAFELFSPHDRVGMLLAEYQGRPLAALMVFALGKTAWYFYGASNNQERNRMPTYRLQWEAIRWARARGCEYYDLWGVPDEDEAVLEADFTQRSDGLWGVYRFKRGFGGRLVRWAGAYDQVLNRALYRLARSLGII